MTTIYFIRHAQSDFAVQDTRKRPLTDKGRVDCKLVTDYLSDKNIDNIISSPYKRAIDTLSDFAEVKNLSIEIIEDLHELILDFKTGSDLMDDWVPFCMKQWSDFTHSMPNGESLDDVQKRNIETINDVLKRYKDKNIVIGTHGIALSTIINYYDSTFGFDDFMAMVNINPWIVKMDFDGTNCIGMKKIDLFKPNQIPDYDNCTVKTAWLDELKAYRFVVVFARFNDKWLYCRQKDTETWGTAGGRIERNTSSGLDETPLEAAKRELYEETGALRYDITPAFDYSVHIPTEYSNGQVFFAQIHELGDLPDYEMAEVGLFDTFPDKMRFPKILPILFDFMQMWLNLKVVNPDSGFEEYWDIYDSNRKPTGRTARRGDKLLQDEYHLVVHVWLQNSKGEFLISQRAPNKGYPLFWECTGGSAIAGDDSLSAAIREVKEELGLDVLPENGKCIYTEVSYNNICDVWLFKQDFDLNDVVFQEYETIDARYADVNEIIHMMDNNEFYKFDYFEKLFNV